MLKYWFIKNMKNTKNSKKKYPKEVKPKEKHENQPEF